MDTLLSLITMYSYDSTIFDNLVVPAEMDADLLTDNLMLEVGELELLYNDPNFMKFAIGKWSLKEVGKWQKLYNTTVLEYNPIENYNRTDTFTDTETRDLNVNSLETKDLSGGNLETRNLDATENQTKNLSGTNVESRNLGTTIVGNTASTDTDVKSGGDTTTKFVQGYNGLSETQAERETTTLGSTNEKTIATETTQVGTDSGTVSNNSTDLGTDNKTMTDTGTVENARTDTGTVANNVDDTGTKTTVNVGSSTGNIGVKTTQKMIEEERKILELNIYDYIINSFKCRFCILVY